MFPCQIAPRFNIQYCTSKYSMKEQPIWYIVVVHLAPNNIFQTLDGGGAPLFGCPIVSIEVLLVLLSNLPPLPTTAIDQENLKYSKLWLLQYNSKYRFFQCLLLISELSISLPPAYKP